MSAEKKLEVNISVIIPVYNVEAYLSQCITSVLEQQVVSFEVILVDDGSTDTSGALCDAYAKQDARVRVIHQSNQGLSAARNRGILAANGAYFTFVDSDDFLLPNMLGELYGLVQQGADIACCASVRCDAQVTPEAFAFASPLPAVQHFIGTEKMTALVAEQKIAVTSWGKLYKACLFQEIRFPIGRYHEDLFTTYRLVAQAKKVSVSNQPGYVYRRNPNSILTSRFSEKKFDAVDAKLEQAHFLEETIPSLQKYGYSAVISACNHCAMPMFADHYQNAEWEAKLKTLYHKYGWYYLRNGRSFFGKLFTLAMMLNFHLAKFLFLHFAKGGGTT